MKVQSGWFWRSGNESHTEAPTSSVVHVSYSLSSLKAVGDYVGEYFRAY